MTWPIQPLGPRPNEPTPIAPVERSADIHRRDARDEEEERRRRGERERRRRAEEAAAPVAPDDDGHIDVLA